MASLDELRLREDFYALLDADDALGKLESWIWSELCNGAKSKSHPWTLASISTLQRQGNGDLVPRSRTVVLRGVDAQQRTLDFHTDRRSDKMNAFSDLNGVQAVCWLFYRHETRLQIRIDATAQVLAPDSTRVLWDNTSDTSRGAYATIDPPGTPLETSRRTADSEENHGPVEDGGVSKRTMPRKSVSLGNPQQSEIDWASAGAASMDFERAERNFCVVRTSVNAVDATYLNPVGNRRLRIDYSGEVDSQKPYWVVP